MNTEIINIGDELLIGQVLNSNAQWMAEQLTAAGYNVRRMVIVADRMEDILGAFAEAQRRCDLVLVTGGLGPTNDDLTREALCRYYQCGMKTDPDSLQRVTSLFERRGIQLTPLNRLQADVPEASEAVPNEDGTSPGMWFDRGGKVMVALPGVPFELKSMMQRTVLPRLQQRFHAEAVVSRTILTQGIGESFLAARIAEWEKNLPAGCSLAYLPQPGIVRLRLLMRGAEKMSLQRQIDAEVERLKALIPEAVFGYNDDTLAEVVGHLLHSAGQTLATAESCTGGTIAQMITAVPGCSEWFNGSMVAYSNKVKINQLQVPAALINKHGAVSEDVVRVMAENVRNLLNADYSIAVSGIAGPDGGSPEKPVGTTWIAVAGPKGITAEKFLFGDHRGRNITRAALTALNMLRLAIGS